jgi:hypothetical protein
MNSAASAVSRTMNPQAAAVASVSDRANDHGSAIAIVVADDAAVPAAAALTDERTHAAEADMAMVATVARLSSSCRPHPSLASPASPVQVA